MLKILAIADDLTGASDVGARFAQAGVPAAVWSSWKEADIEQDTEVFAGAINTASRHVAPEEAVRRVCSVVDRLKPLGVEEVYKKTDSVLRGNIAAEIGALARAWKPVLYVPALPVAGRTVRGGCVYLEGVPVHETHFSRDPLHPVQTSSIRELMRDLDLPLQFLDLEELRSGGARISREAKIIVADGETDADLDRIADLARPVAGTLAYAGPAAFAEKLIGLFDVPSQAFAQFEIPGPILAVSGSITPTSQRQVYHAIRAGWTPLRVPPEWVTEPSMPAELLGRQPFAALPCGNIVMHTALDEAEALQYAAGAAADSSAVSIRLAQIASAFFRAHPFGSLVLFGGETSSAMLEELGCRKTIVRGEIEPGVNVLDAFAADRRFTLVTKSGGFGSEALLSNLVQRRSLA